MEPLCPNLDLKPTPCSPISPRFSKPTSLLLPSHRFSCSDRSVSRKWRVSAAKSEAHESFSHELIRSIGKIFLASSLAAAASFSLCFDSPAMAESLTVAFPVSPTTEVNSVQRTLVEAWGLIRDTFVDPTFNHQDWDLKLQLFALETVAESRTVSFEVSRRASTTGYDVDEYCSKS